jgi:hypothetical protein
MASFLSYDARNLLTAAMIARIATQFHLPAERTEIQSDFHYQSTETPNELDTWAAKMVKSNQNTNTMPRTAASVATRTASE